MNITYKTTVIPPVEEIIRVYRSSGINRPVTDPARIRQMYTNSNLVVTAWQEDRLVGVSRALTDFCYCCYLSDLAVDLEFQNQGIGRKLVKLTRERLGESVTLILVAAPEAINYYEKIGMIRIDNGFVIKRER
ncbi:GNAT family N-acetyltransferase [Mucilaginibacter corticis]|uniref:GNAT family N-acetyltransferase n=1 Tax=Mucilaginibacter corticis TaxID=2597670 RepID=A0A556MIN8_9SPHI|nr:GNAT family N-acetyltransferase [Mucilaginibacter corticis]TSJ39729.1 GNAT family N-acetyltransferase [Mucilaginibacter corticis]